MIEQVQTGAQRIMEQGIIGVLLVLVCIGLVCLYLRDEKKIEALRKEKDTEIKQLNEEKEAILKETLLRENERAAIFQKVLEAIRPGA